jgi:hypothetical protein
LGIDGQVRLIQRTEYMQRLRFDKKLAATEVAGGGWGIAKEIVS